MGAPSMSLQTAAGIPTTTAIDFTVGRVDVNGNKTPALKAVYKGLLSGTTVSSLTLVEGTDQLHPAGTPVEITFTAATHNDSVDWGLAQHNQDGTHGNLTTGTIISAGLITANAGLAIATGQTLTGSNYFSSQIQSYTNTGSAGGTFYYINLGGIKLLWGITAAQASGNPGNTYGVTFPTSFFSTVQTVTATPTNPASVIDQHINVASYSASSATIYFITGSAATVQASVFVIGT